MAFLFETLEVYRRSLEWVERAEAILQKAGSRISRNLADQFSRAALSIPLNLAEGSGRWHHPDKRQFYWIARGSVFECVPILHIVAKRGSLTPEEHRECRMELDAIAKMITCLIKSTEMRRGA